ncbi:MAG: cysteine desulfurase-like protein [Bacteroidales bacterium]|nr:cysteine desulfurase-like protein [Bacteroidales bacterium]MCF8402480.1 cysteine desulfurase-like protein [Bacteroidales bacterium]
MRSLDLPFSRSFFPALKSDWVFMDNAGGTQTAVQVTERITDYLCNTNVQLGASYDISVQSGNRVIEAQEKWAEVINASDPCEVVFGSSTTMLLQSLSRSLVKLFKPGDEVIVTNCDHEANIGPWMAMKDFGIEVKVWELNQESFTLEIDDLKKLLTNRTRLVAFTHVSNILGTINPVKEFTKFIHQQGAMVCVDGVAAAPHRLVDVQELEVDFYVFSLYKVFGPHYSLLYVLKKQLEVLPGINHFFIRDLPYKLQPGNVNYELTYGLLGITDYFTEIAQKHLPAAIRELRDQVIFTYDLFADHEEQMATLLLDFLNSKPGVKVIGERSGNKTKRVSTISFTVNGKKSSDIPLKVDKHKIAIRYGDFYARRLITDMGLTETEGVVRVSLVHYNTMQEVNRLIDVLDQIV